jgi:hypothetical protein
MLSISRILSGSKEDFDLAPIQTESKYSKATAEEFRTFIPRFISSWKIDKINLDAMTAEPLKFHWSTKSGPTGPAILMAYWEFTNYLDSGLKLLTKLDRRLAPIFTWLTKIKSSPQLHRVFLDAFTRGELTTLRKISVKEDREGKSRIFGILDYWSQQALKPLHTQIFSRLRRLNPDFTFNQGRALVNLSGLPGPFHSIDLSSATDRFPISLQEMVLSELTNPEYAKAWRAVLTDLPFHHGAIKHPIYYRAGQPMGAYSSWGMFALTHHCLVAFAASKIRNSKFKDYVLLGDDIVIASNEVADSYKEICNQLDIPFSPMKTHTSLHSYEFAKRWVHKGHEVSPYPISGLISVVNKWHYLHQFTVETESKGYQRPSVTGPLSFEELFKALYPGQERFHKYLTDRIQLLECMPKKGDSLDLLTTKLTKLFSTFNIPGEWKLGSENIEKILSHSMSRALEHTIHTDSARLMKAYQLWDANLQKAKSLFDLWANKTLGAVVLWESIFPVLGSINDKIIDIDEKNLMMVMKLSEDASYEIIETPSGYKHSNMYFPLQKVWDLVESLEITIIPKLHGVLPMRRSQTITGAKALYALNFVKSIKEMTGMKVKGSGPFFDNLEEYPSYLDVTLATKAELEGFVDPMIERINLGVDGDTVKETETVDSPPKSEDPSK